MAAYLSFTQLETPASPRYCVYLIACFSLASAKNCSLCSPLWKSPHSRSVVDMAISLSFGVGRSFSKSDLPCSWRSWFISSASYSRYRAAVTGTAFLMRLLTFAFALIWVPWIYTTSGEKYPDWFASHSIQRYAMFMSISAIVLRNEGILYKRWINTHLNSTTVSMLVRPLSLQYSSSTKSFEY